MYHLFDVENAKKYGVAAAVILYNLKYWILKNKANQKHFHDGRTWSYNSVRAFEKLFPYLTKKQIWGAIQKLIKEGVILTGNYNLKPYDRTLWYSLKNEKSLLPQGKMDFPPGGKGLSHHVEPVPNPKPYKLPDKKTMIEISSEDRLDLDLKINEAKKKFMRAIDEILHPAGKEVTTFTRITQHLVKLCQLGQADPSIFEAAISWAKEAKANGRRPKALFVAKVKQEAGFKAQSKVL